MINLNSWRYFLSGESKRKERPQKQKNGIMWGKIPKQRGGGVLYSHYFFSSICTKTDDYFLKTKIFLLKNRAFPNWRDGGSASCATNVFGLEITLPSPLEFSLGNAAFRVLVRMKPACLSDGGRVCVP